MRKITMINHYADLYKYTIKVACLVLGSSYSPELYLLIV
jgi:hypothetical protein